MLSTKSKIALASLVQRPVVALRGSVGLPSMFTTRRGGLRWHLDLKEGIDFSIWLLGAFERRTVRAYSRIVRPGDVVLDIGANIGAHTLPLACRVGGHGRVYAFEPVQWAIAKLRSNLSLNPSLAERVAVRQVMLGERLDAPTPDMIHASWPLDARADDVHPHLRARAMSTDGAVTTTLDAFVEREGIRRIDFIKLDVDGNECHVLRGGRQTLARFRPPIVIELSPHEGNDAGDTMETLLDLLIEAGYELNDLNTRAPLPRDRAALYRIIPPRGGINALAIAAAP